MGSHKGYPFFIITSSNFMLSLSKQFFALVSSCVTACSFSGKASRKLLNAGKGIPTHSRCLKSPMPFHKNFLAIFLAIAAVILWSVNFIVARAMVDRIPPVSLAFFRWASATLILLPFALRQTKKDWPMIKKSAGYFFWVSLSGIALFNTFVYFGGHYTTATNLAIIGTTSSPVMSIILARIFLKEKIDRYKLGGMMLCIAGILYLLAKGDWHNLINFHFTKGDKWVLLGAFCFAVYNILVRKKPRQIAPNSFLFVAIAMGAIMLFPFYIAEQAVTPPVKWDLNMVLIILFLGAGASALAYSCWNAAINVLGTGRTALFGNLLPVFSSIEAVLILNESFTFLQLISMIIVFSGILLANLTLLKN